MVTIKSFRALRPAPEQAKLVSCVPYDVVYESEVREFISNNSNSFLRVTRPEAEFPEGETPSSDMVHERGRMNLQKFIDDEILVLEDEPSIYIYRIAANNHEQTGIVACCSLDEYEQDLIKKHEKTRPDKVEDRTDHMLALRAQSGLIFQAFRGTEQIRQLVSAAVRDKPLYDFQCPSGIKQTIWRVERPEDYIAAFEEVPALYIADGHHRIESASSARKTLRDNNPSHSGKEDYNFVVAGMFPAEDLQILAYNRVVKDLNGLSEEEFLEKVRQNFVFTGDGKKEPEHPKEFCMYMDGRWQTLRFNVDFFVKPNPIEDLDASILQDYLLEPVLGIEDVRTNKRIGFVGGARGTAELEKVVNEGTAKVAFSMFPTTMEELFAVSDIGEIMPPKSTWFEPKLRDGLLVHKI